MHAAERVRQHHQPVEERRLVEVRLALQQRHDPLAGRQHLARDLGVAALVRLQQVEVQARVEQEGRQGQQDEHRRPARAQVGGGAAGEEGALPEQAQARHQGGGPGGERAASGERHPGHPADRARAASCPCIPSSPRPSSQAVAFSSQYCAFALSPSLWYASASQSQFRAVAYCKRSDRRFKYAQGVGGSSE